MIRVLLIAIPPSWKDLFIFVNIQAGYTFTAINKGWKGEVVSPFHENYLASPASWLAVNVHSSSKESPWNSFWSSPLSTNSN